MSDVLRIQPDDSAERDDRFHRFKLIGWWDQDKLARAKIVVNRIVTARRMRPPL